MATELTVQGHTVSRTTVARLQREDGYSLQGTANTHEGDDHPDRDAQFRQINRRVRAFMKLSEPVISVEGKKELIGEFIQRGREWRTVGDPCEVNAYDFPELVVGKAVPYGVYDLQANVGWVTVGSDHDTAAFAVTTIQHCWEQMGHLQYPAAMRLLMCADSEGE